MAFTYTNISCNYIVDFANDAVSVISSYDCESVTSSTSMCTVVTEIYKPSTEPRQRLTVRQRISKKLRAVKKAFTCCVKPATVANDNI